MSILVSVFTFGINPIQRLALEKSWYAIATATEKTHSGNIENFNHFAEGILLQMAFLLKIGIECIALLILAWGILRSIQKLPSLLKHTDRQKALLSLRLKLGMSLAVSLEFLLAADIAATAVSPSWDALGKLAAISGIRTFLNFFLQKEVHELEEKKSKTLTEQSSVNS
ncbi:DUF1622 domain-containing protein [Mastigocoleus testarum]|uniref:DUF1622 domain-containing protein n=1 Tax=Mastigocoleus testarum BC008 TaxID=371196 RepID=A0A0V7ZVW5_9CYAN|nr:DUF1622 domain-containing protein [Mastigocoleus testarum]KST68727.1 hypothetical protein BC008_01860 [Mastigocoleus testarum BC008]KST68739.1 hypothetical protein BC008_01920 [Mastigocoleus testarum BC008]